MRLISLISDHCNDQKELLITAMGKERIRCFGVFVFLAARPRSIENNQVDVCGGDAFSQTFLIANLHKPMIWTTEFKMLEGHVMLLDSPR